MATQTTGIGTNQGAQTVVSIEQVISRITNGTATSNDEYTYRQWLQQQVKEGKADYDKDKEIYTFKDSDWSVSYSKDTYQRFIKGEKLSDALKEQVDSGAKPITADECYQVLTGGTSNRSLLDKALSYYAMHYDEVNAVDNNSLRAQKGDSVKDIVMKDEYMRLRLAKLAQIAISYNTGINKIKATDLYSNSFLKDFGTFEDSQNVSDVDRTEEKTANDIAKEVLGNSTLNLSDQTDFKLPDMGDYYLGNVDTTYLDLISERYENKKDAHAAAFYAETAPEKTLGYNEDTDIYFLKAKVNLSDNDIKDGFMGTDFITLFVDQVSAAEGDATAALEKLSADIANKTAGYPSIAGSSAGNMFELQLVGISSPKPARWATETNVKKSSISYKGIKKGDTIETFLSNSFVISFPDMLALLEQKGNDSTNDFCFIYVNGKWHQAELISETNGTCDFRWLIDPGSETVSTIKQKGTESIDKSSDVIANMALAQGISTLRELINSAGGTIYIRFEGAGLKEGGSANFPAAMFGALSDITAKSQLLSMTANSSDITASGLNRIHTTSNRRYLGEVFIKMDSQYGNVFINLAKYILGTIEDNPDANKLYRDETGEYKMTDFYKMSDVYEGKNNHNFVTRDYDIDSKVYADAFFETLDILDDRREIQQAIHGENWDNLHEYNVTIGDVTFFVPPVNIRMQTHTQSERMQLLRAAGSATKTDQHMTRVIAMDIFFNEERGINGYQYTTTLNDSEKTPVVYSLNGLRALVSQFKFTPFLPITNTFINETLGIEAVTVSSLQITSVHNYPKLIHATITMLEFDWTVYMPDISQLKITAAYGAAILQEKNWEDLQAAANAATDENGNVVTNDAIEEAASDLRRNSKYINWFEKTINWKTFRYYYQRAIRRGDLLKNLPVDFNSEEYIYYTSGGLTCLVPMEFTEPRIKFYMANEDYLKELLKARFEYLSKTGTKGQEISFSPDQIKFLEALDELRQNLLELSQNAEFRQCVDSANELIHMAGIFSDADDLVGNLRPDSFYNKGCITNGMGLPQECVNRVNACLARIDQITQDVRARHNNYFEYDPEYFSIINKDGTKVSFAVAIRLKRSALTDTEMGSFRQTIKNFTGTDPFQEQGNWQGWIDDAIDRRNSETMAIPDHLVDSNQDRIIIPMSIGVKKQGYITDVYKIDPYSNFDLDSNTAGMKLLSQTDHIINTYKDKKASATGHPDVNALMNLVYDPYAVTDDSSEGFLVVDWRATLTNHLARIRVISNDSYAPQYLGGEDTEINITIRTQNKQAATMLTAIPKQISRLTRMYHLVMPCVPLRIESEFSKFLSVNDVTCEQSVISTVANHPGLYEVNMTFISMNRTIREREAATKKAINNAGWNYYGDDSLTDYGKGQLYGVALGSVAGLLGGIAGGVGALTLKGVGALLATTAVGAAVAATGACLLVGIGHVISDVMTLNSTDLSQSSAGDGTINRRKFRHYFDIKNSLAEMDLYPDLELPMIAEMEAAGFYYTRYKFQDNRLYVDPDFYFIYPVKLTSNIYRELAIHGMEGGIGETKLTDVTGACVTVKPAQGSTLQATASNDTYNKQAQTARDIRLGVIKLKEELRKDGEENIKQNPKVEMPFMALVNLTMERDSWSVCDNIQGMFLEKRFLQEIKTYENTNAAATAGNVNETRGTGSTTNTDAADKESEGGEVVQTENQQNKQVVHTEGSYIFNQQEKAIQAAEEFYKWLSTKTIEQTIPNMAVSAGVFLETGPVISNGQVFSIIKTAVVAWLGLSEVQDFLSALYVDINNKFVDLVQNIVCAAACVSGARKEFSGAESSDDWKPDCNFVGVQLGTSQNAGGSNEVLWPKDKSKQKECFNVIVKHSLEFSIYRFKMLTDQELYAAIYKGEEAAIEKPYTDNIEEGNVNYSHFLLDPGYRTATVELIEEYKGKCITSMAYATYAYLRLLFYWLCRLVYLRVFPNFSTDIARSHAQHEISVQNTTKSLLGESNAEVMVKGTGDRLVSLRKHIDFFSKNMHTVDSGKIWTAAILTSSEGDASILKAIEDRNYDALNAIIETCAAPTSKFSPINNQGALTIRKMTLALVGLGVMSRETAGSSQTTVAIPSNQDTINKLYLEAADDPTTYIPHSFHDMIVSDARGRMLRAFPTFFMTFIDEGREIGFWKLHDNFYNVNAISSIEVVKSRKLPADTCIITMSNFFNSFATEDEDYIRTVIAPLHDAYNSIFSPKEYFQEQEVARSIKPPEPKLRLRPGARLHVRMGYGNNADMLPIVFNGVIAEVSSEATVQIVAQGDGIELLNPINIDKEAHNLPNEDDFFGYSAATNAISPLQLATAMFTIHGGLLNEQLRKRLKFNLTPRNPFGIVHFGDPDFKSFCKTGECCQNLYEMTTKPMYGGSINDLFSNSYNFKDITRITFDLFQKTPWDVLNICKSISPDAKLAVVPFMVRSTVFMGMPHYYYAYDYYIDEDNVAKEKRKPFEQWHIYTAEQDIIGNGVVATTRDVKTVAMGLYQICETFNSKSQQRVGPLYADFDIYSDCQRTMVVDTSLLGKGPPFVGTITNYFSTWGCDLFSGQGGIDALFDDTGPVASHKKIAWRATASKLRESVMDMYAGDLVVIGDASVKPQDRFFMSDKYSCMHGQCLVKEVVHRLSVENGFTTTISPDCIAVVNDKAELLKYESMNRIGGLCAMSATTAEELNDSTSWLSVAARTVAYAGIGLATTGAVGLLTTRAIKQAATFIMQHSPMFATATGTVLGGMGKVVQTIGNFVSRAPSILGRVGTSIAARGASMMLAGGAAGATGAGVIAGGILGTISLPIIAATTIASALIMPLLNSWVAEQLRNYKVITIYPIKKFGYAYTAGFEGARGTVYGSPTWGDRGSFGDVLDYMQEEYPIVSSVLGFLASDEVGDLAKKYQKDNAIIGSDGEPVVAEEEYNKMMAHLAGAPSSYFSNSYRSNQIVPRAGTSTPVAFTNAYNHYKKLDTKNWKNDLGDNVFIPNDTRLRPYIKEQFLTIVHVEPGTPVDGQKVTDENVTVNGKTVRLKAIHTVDGKGNAVVDIPFLHRDAIHILYEIIKRAKKKMPPANSQDPQEYWEQNKNDHIALKSALRVGDRTSMGATGFTFVLQATADNSKRALKSAIEEFHQETKSYEGNPCISSDIFEYKQQDNGEVSVVVTMTSVSGQPESSSNDSKKKEG